MRLRLPISIAALAGAMAAAGLLSGSPRPSAGQGEAPPAEVPQTRPDGSKPGPGGGGPAPEQDELEPCGEATDFNAHQAGEVVTIVARGSHRTAGFRVVLEQSPIRIFPPQFVLKHDKPDGPVAQVITPFRVRVMFKASGQDIRSVIVHDAGGRHEVKVGRGDPGDGGDGKPKPSKQTPSATPGAGTP